MLQGLSNVEGGRSFVAFCEHVLWKSFAVSVEDERGVTTIHQGESKVTP